MCIPGDEYPCTGLDIPDMQPLLEAISQHPEHAVLLALLILVLALVLSWFGE